MNTRDGVPLDYRGVWRRTLYAGEGEHGDYVEDRSTRVVWLQTTHWHADLRVPADRPDAGSVMSLEECSREQLVWLASQTAFAGLTRVEGRFCTWHRLIDLYPGLEKDIGEMVWLDDGTLEERHPHGRYIEHWERQQAGSVNEQVCPGPDGLTRWLQFGDHAMSIVPRPALTQDHDLLATPESLETSALRLRAGLEISYAQRAGDSWRVVLSTQPWREGRRITPPPD